MRFYLLLIILLLSIFKLNLFSQLNPDPPIQTVRLVFIHHSVGEDWLKPEMGDLIHNLNENNYYVFDTNYDWGPTDQDVNDGNPIGYHTDIGHWYNWFLGPHREIYLTALYNNNHLTPSYTNSDSLIIPTSENVIVMFKSCFTSAQVIYGDTNDQPLPIGMLNPLYGKGVDVDTVYTVTNIKGLYRDLLTYFAIRQDKLFILITISPSYQGAADEGMVKLRAINNWLVYNWLENYPYENVSVFDFSNVLTSNGGNPNINDAGLLTGNHHRFRNGTIEHTNDGNIFLAYPSYDSTSNTWDNHPTAAGLKKATIEFVPLLNIAYNRWKNSTKVENDGLHSNEATFKIKQNIPNPFNNITTFEFYLPTEAYTSLKIFDINGQEIASLINANLRAGYHTIYFDAKNLSSGVYFFNFIANNFQKINKMVIIK